MKESQNSDSLKKIQFYRGEGPNGFLSNFYSSPFSKDGKKYATVQHYFQSKKFQGKHMETIIIEADSPAEAFRLGRNANVPLRQDWEEVKEKIMLEGLRAKFTQNKHLAQQLINTYDSKLVQHTKNDKFWADGGDGSGQNKLGILLMRVRQELK